MSLLIVLCLSLSAVSAADDGTIGDVNGEDISLDDSSINIDDTVSSVEKDNSDILSSPMLNDDSSEVKKYYVNSSVETTGDGSESSPFKTINESIGVINENETVEIYIASGVYNSTGDYNLELRTPASISFIGDDKSTTIVDMLNENKFARCFKTGINLVLKDLTLVNAYSPDMEGAFIIGGGDLTIDNCNFANSTGYQGLISTSRNLNIYNSNFENLKAAYEYGQGGLIRFYQWSGNDDTIIIDNCEFNNVTGGNSGAGDVLYCYGSSIGIVNVTNSIIASCGEPFYFAYNLYNTNITFDTCKFYNNNATSTNGQNSGGISVCGNTKGFNVFNCEFENCTSVQYGGAIYTQSSTNNFKNNIITNCSSRNDVGILANSISNTFIVTVLENDTVEFSSSSIVLNATLTDDMGNLIAGPSTDFYLDGTRLNKQWSKLPFNKNGVASYTYKGYLPKGDYLVSTVATEADNVKTGIIRSNPIENLSYYVATTGSDENGDGSEENPFATLAKAVSVATTTFNPTIYIKGGTYNIDSQTTYNVDFADLSIKGYDGDVIFDMDGNDGFAIFHGASTSNFYLENLKIINGYGNSRYGVVLFDLGHGHVKNCTFEDNYGTAIRGYISTVDTCSFINNSAQDEFSANDIYVNYQLTGINFTVVNSIFESSYAGRNIYVYQNYDDGLIENCIFNNASVYVDPYGNVNITDSTFLNCEKTSVKSQGQTNILDCGFVDSSKTSIMLSGGYDYNVINCGFENCYSDSSAPCIYLSSGSLFLENNTVVNCNSKDKGNYVYARDNILSHVNIVVMNNETYEVVSFGANLNAKLSDDNGNDIVLDGLNFYLNDEFATSAPFVGNEAQIPYKALLNGTYVVSADSYSVSNNTIKTATITVTPLMEKDLYVATTGSDESGDGTEANPYATLKKAIDEAVAYNNTIHVAEGVYVIDTALDIDTNTAILNIVGSGENTVFDMANESTFISSLSAKSIVELKDFTLVNGKSSEDEKGGFITSSGNLILNNLNFVNSTAKEGGAIRNFGNLTVAYSYFENTVASDIGGAISSNWYAYVYVMDSVFNQTSADMVGAIYTEKYLYLKNNTFIDVTANDGETIYAAYNVDGVILTVMDNETWEIDSSSITLNATLTDDNGNPIFAEYIPITFYLDGVKIASAQFGDEYIITSSADLKLTGTHILSATLGDSEDIIIKTATLNFVNPDVLQDVYVSNAGSDVTGDGTDGNPFATIDKALTVVSSVNGVIHVLNEIQVNNIIAVSDLYDLTIKGENNAKLNASGANQLMTIASSASVNLIDLGLVGSYFDENTPVANQGGIRNNGILNVINCTFEEDNYYISTWEFWDNIGGAAIYNSGGVLTITDSTFKNNVPNGAYGTNQGGLIYSNKNLTIINSSFINNKIAQNSNYGNYYGGLIYSTGTALLDGVKFINTSFNARDGQLYGLVYSTNDLTVNNSCFDSNYYNNIRYGSASGLAIYSTRNIVIDNSNFTNNYVRDQSGIAGQGVVYFTGSKNIISNSRFESNEIGKTVYASGTTSIDTCTFKDNKGGSGGNGYGIGVYVASGTANITNSLFKGNTASMGTVYSNFATTYLSGNTIDSNEVQTGTIYVSGGNVYVSDNLIKSNYASVEGGVAYVNMGNLYLYDDNTVRGNTATTADYVSLNSNAKIAGSTYTLVFADNGTYSTEGNYFDVNATLFDAKGNPIYGATVNFYLNETAMASARINASGVTPVTRITSNNKGEYILTGLSNNILNQDDCIVKTALLSYDPIHEIIAYVDGALGSDVDGNGSEDNPYLTISKGIEEASKAVNGIVYIQPGTYTGDLNTNLNVVLADGSSLRVIGLRDTDDDIIIDLESAEGSYAFNVSSQSESKNAVFALSSIVIVNGNLDDITPLISTENCEVELFNILFEDNVGRLIGIKNSVFDGESIVVLNSFTNETSNMLILFSNSSFNLNKVAILDSVAMTGIFVYQSDKFEDSCIDNLIVVDNEISNLFRTSQVSAAEANNLNVKNAIIENNDFSSLYAGYLHTMSISNSILVNNNLGIISKGISLEDNWWGSNSNPNKALGADLVKNWIVAEITANESDIIIGEDVKFNVKLLLHDGSSLSDNLDTRVVKAIADNANFTSDEVLIENNVATLYATANAKGDIELVIDNQSFIFTVSGKDTFIISTVLVEMDYGDDGIITIKLIDGENPVANANVSAVINYVTYEGITDDEGIAEISIGKLDVGAYTVEYIFDGNDLYEASAALGFLNIEKVDPTLTVDAEDVACGEPVVINITLTGANGEKLSANITLVLNNCEETVEIIDGEESLLITDVLSPNTYNAVVIFAGDNNYNSAIDSVEFTVAPVDIDLTVTVAEDDNEVIITLLDGEGNPISGATIDVTVNDQAVTVPETDDNGETGVEVDGNSIVTASYTDGNGVTVSASIAVVLNTKELTDLVENLTAELNQTQEALDEAKNNISELNGKVYELTENLTQALSDLDTANEKVDNLTDALADAQADLAVANEKVDNLTAQLNNLTDALADALADLATANEKVDNLTDALADAQADLAVANEKVDNLTTALADTNAALAVANEKVDNLTADVTALNTTIGEQAAVIDGLNNTVNSQAALIDTLNNTVNEQSGLIDDLLDTVDVQTALIEGLNETVANQSATIQSQNDMINALNEAVANLTNTVNNLTEIIKTLNTTRAATVLVADNLTTFAYDSKIDGDIGDNFTAILTDANGNPLANMTVQMGLNGKIYNRTTDENGKIYVLMKTKIAGRYTFAVSFLGNDQYNASFTAVLGTVNKQTPKLTTSNKSYKASAKTKTISATFKTASGNPVSGKTIKFTVNGKTYSGTTNSKGVASVNVSISKKGTYTFTAKYAGDSTYASVSKSAKLTIK